MSDPYIGEIQLFGFTFNPRGWAYCNGALLPIQQNTALFSLLGTAYGGNGTSTFQLPNLAGRAVCSQGQGGGLTDRARGETFGSESVTLQSNEIPTHRHTLKFYGQSDPNKRKSTPSNGDAFSLPTQSTSKFFTSTGPANTPLNIAIADANPGGGQPHPNMQPYLALNFCIALQGIFPSRN